MVVTGEANPPPLRVPLVDEEQQHRPVLVVAVPDGD